LYFESPTSYPELARRSSALFQKEFEKIPTSPLTVQKLIHIWLSTASERPSGLSRHPLTDAKIGNRFKRAAGEFGSLTLLE
jgi:hypothetical protein